MSAHSQQWSSPLNQDFATISTPVSTRLPGFTFTTKPYASLPIWKTLVASRVYCLQGAPAEVHYLVEITHEMENADSRNSAFYKSFQRDYWP